jgi:hypothetical protein
MIGIASYGADVEPPLATHRPTFSKHDSDVLVSGLIKFALSQKKREKDQSAKREVTW